jgi:hypothetical protein
VDGLHYIVVTNTDPWTYIGSRALHPTPQASFDADLDIFARTRMGAPGVLFTMAQISRSKPRPVRWGSVVYHDRAEFSVETVSPNSHSPDSHGPDSRNPDSHSPDSRSPDSRNPDPGGSGSPMPLQVDGELIGDRTVVRFTSIRNALNMIVSPGL